MSSPIKPPGDGPRGPRTLDRTTGSTWPKAPEGPSETFRSTLGRAAASPPVASSEAVPRLEGLGSLLEDLRAGKIDAQQLLDQLVQRQLDSASARALTAAARSELEASLRRALAEDPTLLALTKDLRGD